MFSRRARSRAAHRGPLASRPPPLGSNREVAIKQSAIGNPQSANRQSPLADPQSIASDKIASSCPAGGSPILTHPSPTSSRRSTASTLPIRIAGWKIPTIAETIAWVDAQNALTRDVLDRSIRRNLVERLTALLDYPRSGPMVRRGGRYFVTHNTGLQDQPLLYVAERRNGPWRVLLDPNTLSADGTVALTAYFPSEDGTLLAYALSSHGSDRQDILIRGVASGIDRQERIRWVKFVTLAWLPDGSGFYYTRFPEPGTVPEEDENYFSSVWFHLLGQPQNADAKIFDAPDHRETVFEVDLSDDGRWLVITAQQGASDRSEIYVVDRADSSQSPRPLFRGFKWAWHFVEAANGRLYFHTDENAPRGRIVSVDPAAPDAMVEIVAESAHKLELALVAGGQLVLAYLRNASANLAWFALDGIPGGEIETPGLGSLTGLDGRPGDPELLVGYTSFTQAPSNFACELPSTSLVRVPEPVVTTDKSRASVPDASNYETRQVWYPSRDGTQVSMFLVHRRDLPKDGDRPVLMTGYGGFNISRSCCSSATAARARPRKGVTMRRLRTVLLTVTLAVTALLAFAAPASAQQLVDASGENGGRRARVRPHGRDGGRHRRQPVLHGPRPPQSPARRGRRTLHLTSVGVVRRFSGARTKPAESGGERLRGARERLGGGVELRVAVRQAHEHRLVAARGEEHARLGVEQRVEEARVAVVVGRLGLHVVGDRASARRTRR